MPQYSEDMPAGGIRRIVCQQLTLDPICHIRQFYCVDSIDKKWRCQRVCHFSERLVEAAFVDEAWLTFNANLDFVINDFRFIDRPSVCGRLERTYETGVRDAMTESIPKIDYSLAGRRVWVAGHSGMAGSAILRRLTRENCEILTVSHSELDLRRQSDVESWLRRTGLMLSSWRLAQWAEFLPTRPGRPSLSTTT